MLIFAITMYSNIIWHIKSKITMVNYNVQVLNYKFLNLVPYNYVNDGKNRCNVAERNKIVNDIHSCQPMEERGRNLSTPDLNIELPNY